MASITTAFKPSVLSYIASWDVASMTRCPSTAAIALSCTLAIGAVLVPIVAGRCSLCPYQTQVETAWN
jgi:hypothetical protein